MTNREASSRELLDFLPINQYKGLSHIDPEILQEMGKLIWFCDFRKTNIINDKVEEEVEVLEAIFTSVDIVEGSDTKQIFDVLPYPSKSGFFLEILGILCFPLHSSRICS